jgi:hypothetical protein
MTHSASPPMDAPVAPDGVLADRWVSVGLVAIVVLFLLARGLVMYRQPVGQDEDCYAVPGLTILRTGLPQLPHVPARNPESVYYQADRMLYSEPPLAFYVQALFYAVLPDEVGTARLAAAVEGLIALLVLYRLGLRVGLSKIAALVGVGLFSWSRWFYFPAMAARPDILCALFGLLAMDGMVKWSESRRPRELVWTGVWLGLGGLSHPFAIIYAAQLAVWAVVVSRGVRRVTAPLILAGMAVAVAAVWIPLIRMYPEAFRTQFANQFGGSAGGPLWWRAIMPWESMAYHAGKMIEHSGAIQAAMVGVGLVVLTVRAVRVRSVGLTAVALVAWSAAYLISVLVGPHHPVIGYWVYPAGIGFLGLGRLVESVAEERSRLIGSDAERKRTFAVNLLGGVVVSLLALVPGCGLRTLVVHLRKGDDINYDATRFANRLMESLPPEAVVAVDTQFAVNFVAAGRTALLATTLPQYFRVDQFDFDYLIISRYGVDNRLAEELGARLERVEGDESDRFACFAQVYRPVKPDPAKRGGGAIEPAGETESKR